MQEGLRDLFERWGLPQRIRVDNGAPWGTGSDLPTALALWWIGLGIDPIWNHPHSPRENAKIERFNGLIESWGDPKRCPDLVAWQARVAWVARVQREVYPSVGNQTRLEANPALSEVGRPYEREREAQQWQLERVQQYLSRSAWSRRVDKVGRISLYNRAYPVGREHRGKEVWVRFDAANHAWVITTEGGEELRRHPADEISAQRICSLDVMARHKRNAAPKR